MKQQQTSNKTTTKQIHTATNQTQSTNKSTTEEKQRKKLVPNKKLNFNHFACVLGHGISIGLVQCVRACACVLQHTNYIIFFFSFRFQFVLLFPNFLLLLKKKTSAHTHFSLWDQKGENQAKNCEVCSSFFFVLVFVLFSFDKIQEVNRAKYTHTSRRRCRQSSDNQTSIHI